MEKSPPTYRIRGTSAGNLLKPSVDSLLACQPKPWRRLVEVAGVEPASLVLSHVASTCLAYDLLSLPKRP